LLLGAAIVLDGTRTSVKAWLLLLLLFWGALLFGGYFFGENEEMPTWTRVGSSLLLVIAAWSWLASAGGQTAVVFRLLLAAGMTLGFVGDVFMAGLAPVAQPVFGGIAAFGCGHSAYIAACVCLGRQEARAGRKPHWGAACFAWLVIGLLGWSAIVLPSLQPTALRMAALGYTLLLASTAGCATGLAFQLPQFRPFAIGAGLFLLSDLILAVGLFQSVHAYLQNAVWLTYGPAQMLIVYGGNVGLIELWREQKESGFADGSGLVPVQRELPGLLE
jgi:YhhN family